MTVLVYMRIFHACNHAKLYSVMFTTEASSMVITPLDEIESLGSRVGALCKSLLQNQEYGELDNAATVDCLENHQNLHNFGKFQHQTYF